MAADASAVAAIDAAEKARGKYAALSFAAIAIVVGLPLWWKTTETYRASLPYSEIAELDTLLFQLTVPVSVVFAKGTLPGDLERKLPFRKPQEAEIPLNPKTSVTSRYEVSYRRATSQEEKTLSRASVPEAGEGLLPAQEAAVGSLTIYVIPRNSVLLPQEVTVYIGKRRSAVVRAPRGSGDVLAAVDAQVREVTRAVSFSLDSIAEALSDRVPLGQLGAEWKRPFKSSLGSSEGQALVVSSNSRILILQILYYAALGVTPRFDAASSSYILSAHSLPHVINPVEARLGESLFLSTGEGEAAYWFLPRDPRSPCCLHIPPRFSASLIAHNNPARERGRLVYNVERETANETSVPRRVDVDMTRVMEVFLAQLRLLFGILPGPLPEGAILESPGNEGLSDWELDRLLWARTVENVATVSTTLTSLAQLLGKISNIVIKDDVASKVYHAVAFAQEALAELSQGRLDSAFQASKAAINASERAFFDPSLLHLLYFPDDQKFAIYIPLFLPMAVPILLSLVKIGREMRHSKKAAIKVD
nr:GPI transamidase component PIG-S [Zootoca vivipara]